MKLLYKIEKDGNQIPASVYVFDVSFWLGEVDFGLYHHFTTVLENSRVEFKLNLPPVYTDAIAVKLKKAVIQTST